MTSDALSGGTKKLAGVTNTVLNPLMAPINYAAEKTEQASRGAMGFEQEHVDMDELQRERLKFQQEMGEFDDTCDEDEDAPAAAPDPGEKEGGVGTKNVTVVEVVEKEVKKVPEAQSSPAKTGEKEEGKTPKSPDEGEAAAPPRNSRRRRGGGQSADSGTPPDSGSPVP